MSRNRRCAPRSAWCRRTPCCSTTPSATTSATVAGTLTDAEVEEAARSAQIDRLHQRRAEGLRDRGRRARPEAVGRREAARRDRPHHPEGAADPAARRGDVGARQPHREGNPGRAGAHLEEPHLARDRAPAVDHRRRRRDHRARPGPHRRARHASAAARGARALRQHVEPAARGRGGAREAGADRRQHAGAASRARGCG